MESWQLPDYIADVLPTTARQLENAKEELLSLFRVHGYELVNPPLMEYTTSLLTKIDPGLSLKTMRVVDQITGRQLGIRADITPQISRIDAHLLSHRSGVNRLCYAAPVLHATPQTLMSTREPLQVGAELYGLESLDADLELMDLMFKSLKILHVDEAMLSLGHVGIFKAIANAAKIPNEVAQRILAHMQSKDLTEIEAMAKELHLDSRTVDALLELCDLYGGREIVAKARRVLPNLPEIGHALDEIEAIGKTFGEKPIHIDFSELRVDYYHTGLLFGVYSEGWSQAIMKGGRYNGLGKYFGRTRYATGFSFDLKDFMEVIPKVTKSLGIAVARNVAAKAAGKIEELRSQGECVIVDYLEEGPRALSCDRTLEEDGKGGWKVVPAS